MFLKYACSSGITSEPGLDKVDNYRPQQARRDLQRAQGKSSFDKFVPGFAVGFRVDINFLLPHRQKNEKCANGRRRREPGHGLFSKRSPDFSRKIQFVVQSAQIARDTLT